MAAQFTPNDLTIIHHLYHRAKKMGSMTAIQYKDRNRWARYSWNDYLSMCESVAAAMMQFDVQPKDRVAILSETRPEWAVADLAIMSCGAITVPIYPNNLEDDVQFVLQDCAAKVLILENAEQLAKWQKISSKCPEVQKVIVINDGAVTDSTTLSWSEALKLGRKHLSERADLVSGTALKAQLSDVATILYTSGTTGRPKGVVLSHEQIISEVADVFSLVSVNPDDISLSFLPYSHILGRVESWGSIYTGYVLAFAESIEKLKSNMQEIRPTFLIAVPRIFEKIYVGILAQVENNPTKRKIFEKALRVGNEVSAAVQAGRPLGIKLAIEYEMARLLVFKNVLQAIGGRMRFAISGGAPLNSEIARFFHGMGLLILEGYGLTETTAAVFVNTPLYYRFGSVGKAIGDVKVRFADDGEILVQTKKNMLGYYNNDNATTDAFDQGYFKTGDIGYMDKNGYLFITDRKKDLIKTAGGKYVAPQKLEGLLKLSPYVSQVLIHGDQKKYIIALLTLNQPVILDYAKKHNLPSGNYEELTQSPEIYTLLKDVVADVNTQLASYESIKKFAILKKDFTVETGELTASLKIKRKFCDNKFKKIIDELY